MRHLDQNLVGNVGAPISLNCDSWSYVRFYNHFLLLIMCTAFSKVLNVFTNETMEGNSVFFSQLAKNA